MPLPEDETEWKNLMVVFATAKGHVRKNSLEDFININNSGKIAMKLDQDDKIVGQRAITIGFHNNSGQLKYKPTYNDKKLIEPGVQASIINVPQNKKSKSII